MRDGLRVQRDPPAGALAGRPDGVVIMCDVAREDASVVIADLKELEIHHERVDRAEP